MKVTMKKAPIEVATERLIDIIRDQLSDLLEDVVDNSIPKKDFEILTAKVLLEICSKFENDRATSVHDAVMRVTESYIKSKKGKTNV